VPLRAALAVVLAAALIAGHGTARAERLVLATADAELEAACVEALGSWRVDIVTAADRAPGTRMPEAAAEADSIARAHAARAVVWIAGGDAAAPGLWLYDVSQRRVVVTPLPSGLPFDAPTAAAVALTIKTLLRTSEVAPPDERLAVPPRPPRRFALEARAGLRARPAPAARWEPRFAVAGVLRPIRGGRLALALGVRAGPGSDIERGDFVGRYRDTAVSAAARLGLPLGGSLRLVPALGLSLHVDSVSGSSASEGASASTRRFNPMLDAALDLELRVRGDVRVSIGLEAGARLRRQRFLAGDQEVFDLPEAEGEMSVSLAVPML
jgi:hypothetical protein